MNSVLTICTVCRREPEKLRSRSVVWGLIGVLLVLAMLCSCASTGRKAGAVQTTQAARVAEPKSAQGWWAVRFKMNWPEGTEPSWYMDLLLAHKVVSPVLQRYKDDIVLWRFHRRAARDQAGHQFSIIFYCSVATARRIHAAIRSDKTLQQLKRADGVIRDSYDNTERVTKPRIEDTSDPNWSPELQKSWPYFIMGVSQTWLDLIELTLPDVVGDKPPSSFSDLKALYGKVNDSINRLWQKEGGHAFLHHLNAIFGYTPVEVYEKRQMTF